MDNLRLSYNTRVSVVKKYFIVTGLCRALLGRPAIEALNLIARLDLVKVDCYKAKYPELFSGLGSMEG